MAPRAKLSDGNLPCLLDSSRDQLPPECHARPGSGRGGLLARAAAQVRRRVRVSSRKRCLGSLASDTSSHSNQASNSLPV